MDIRVKDYYAKNHLYARKIVLPDTSEKFRGACSQCKYYIDVVGQQEMRKVCLSGVRAYYTGTKRVPESIDIMDLIMLLGKERLETMMNKGGENNPAHISPCICHQATKIRC